MTDMPPDAVQVYLSLVDCDIDPRMLDEPDFARAVATEIRGMTSGVGFDAALVRSKTLRQLVEVFKKQARDRTSDRAEISAFVLARLARMGLPFERPMW